MSGSTSPTNLRDVGQDSVQPRTTGALATVVGKLRTPSHLFGFGGEPEPKPCTSPMTLALRSAMRTGASPEACGLSRCPDVCWLLLLCWRRWRRLLRFLCGRPVLLLASASTGSADANLGWTTFKWSTCHWLYCAYSSRYAGLSPCSRRDIRPGIAAAGRRQYSPCYGRHSSGL